MILCVIKALGISILYPLRDDNTDIGLPIRVNVTHNISFKISFLFFFIHFISYKNRDIKKKLYKTVSINQFQ